MAVKTVPAGHNRVSPYFVTPQADELMKFLASAIGAEEIARHKTPDGRIMHAEMRLGDSVLMIGEAEMEKPLIHIYVDDVDETYRRALAAGAASLREPTTQPYGDRSAGVVAFGYQWWLATHVQDVADAEMAQQSKSGA